LEKQIAQIADPFCNLTPAICNLAQAIEFIEFQIADGLQSADFRFRLQDLLQSGLFESGNLRLPD